MRIAALVLFVLASSCDSRSDAGSIERDARRILALHSDDDSGADGDATARSRVDLTAAPWVCSDPMSHKVEPAQALIHVRSRAALRGDAGVVVRLTGGCCRVVARIRIDRLAFASDLRFGLSVLGGSSSVVVGLQDPHALVRFSHSGGEGDARLRAGITSIGNAPESSGSLGPFELGQDMLCTLTASNGKATAELHLRGRPAPLGRATVVCALPPDSYVVGSVHRVGHGGVIDATIEVLSVEGEQHGRSAADADLPAALRNLTLSLPADPLAEIVSQLAAAGPWEPTARVVRPALERLRSVSGFNPQDEREWLAWLPYAWFAAAALRRAPPESRVGETVWPLTEELARALTNRAPYSDWQALARDWQGPRMDVDTRRANQSALLFLLATSREPKGLDELRKALCVCPNDHVARALLKRAREEAGPCQELIDYLLLEQSDARLAAEYSEVLVKLGVGDLARRVAERALQGGVCNGQLGKVIDALPCSVGQREALQDAWHRSRMQGLILLRALVVRQRWMGLGSPAAASARCLLDLDRSPAAVRATIPTLLLEQDEKTLRLLLDDPATEVRLAARAGLQDDPILPRLREGLIARLPR